MNFSKAKYTCQEIKNITTIEQRKYKIILFHILCLISHTSKYLHNHLQRLSTSKKKTQITHITHIKTLCLP